MRREKYICRYVEILKNTSAGRDREAQTGLGVRVRGRRGVGGRGGTRTRRGAAGAGASLQQSRGMRSRVSKRIVFWVLGVFSGPKFRIVTEHGATGTRRLGCRSPAHSSGQKRRGFGEKTGVKEAKKMKPGRKRSSKHMSFRENSPPVERRRFQGLARRTLPGNN